jgi:DNA invertase Pin-like site-specific DNA recombinase
MRVAIYARVSTIDKNQDPETQLLPLRDFCTAQGWEIYRAYIDTASALDIAHRTAWREMLDDAAKKKFSVVLVFKLDRAFRSVKHMHDTLSIWEALGISFRSIREQFETSTALGRLLMNLLAALAEFELELIRERVKAGMDRARRQGKRIGRPKVTDRRGFTDRYKSILERLTVGEISRRKAAKELNIGYATLKRLIDSKFIVSEPSAMNGSNLDGKEVNHDEPSRIDSRASSARCTTD